MTKLSQRAVPLTNALLMDGKKCNTLEAESSLNEKVSTERVEHFVVTDAPRKEYVGEFIPSGGTRDIDQVDVLSGGSC